jgi:plastocyanin
MCPLDAPFGMLRALYLCRDSQNMRKTVAQLGICLGLLFSGTVTFAGDVEGRVTSVRPVDLSSVVVSIDDIEGRFPPSRPAVMDQKSLRFVPHVLPIVTGTIVEFPNSDPLAHNVFSISETKRFNLGLYEKGTVRRLRFDEPGVVQLLCNVHLEMSGFIVVLKNPYFARVNPDGSYRIVGVPAGQHRVRCWQEAGAALELTVVVPASGTAKQDFRFQ